MTSLLSKEDINRIIKSVKNNNIPVIDPVTLPTYFLKDGPRFIPCFSLKEICIYIQKTNDITITIDVSEIMKHYERVVLHFMYLADIADEHISRIKKHPFWYQLTQQLTPCVIVALTCAMNMLQTQHDLMTLFTNEKNPDIYNDETNLQIQLEHIRTIITDLFYDDHEVFNEFNHVLLSCCKTLQQELLNKHKTKYSRYKYLAIELERFRRAISNPLFFKLAHDKRKLDSVTPNFFMSEKGVITCKD